MLLILRLYAFTLSPTRYEMMAPRYRLPPILPMPIISQRCLLRDAVAGIDATDAVSVTFTLCCCRDIAAED